MPKTSQPALFQQPASSVQITPNVQPGPSFYSSASAILSSAPKPRCIAAGTSTSQLHLSTVTEVTGSSTACLSSLNPLPLAASAASDRESNPTAPIASSFTTLTSFVMPSAVAQPFARVKLLAISSLQLLTSAEPRSSVSQTLALVKPLTISVAPQSTLSSDALAVALTAAQLESGPSNVVAATVDTSAMTADTSASSRRRQAFEPCSRGSTAKRVAHVAFTSDF